MSERLEEIERLIEHRDEHMNNDCDYSNAYQYVHLLSDEGHIDYLVKQNKRYRELLIQIEEGTNHYELAKRIRQALESESE